MTSHPCFTGMRILLSEYLVQNSEPYEVRLSWRKRLLSWPWRPWQATVTVVDVIPYQGAFQINSTTLVMHPDTYRKVKEGLAVEVTPPSIWN